ncbi:MAG: tetratricopeptide repeat protein [Planctomycetota bacterium]
MRAAAILLLVVLAPPSTGQREGGASSRDDAGWIVRSDGVFDPAAAQGGTIQVAHRPAPDGGETLWSVVATRAPLDRLLPRIGQEGGLRIAGLRALERTYIVTADLRDRRLTQMLEYVLGSVGLQFDLRSDTITVRVPPETPASDEVLNLASVAWLNAASRFPEHPSAPLAQLSQGEILELRGNHAAALSQYQLLVETYPHAELADDAYMRSGRILQRMGRWSEAAVQFEELLERGHDLGYHPAARLEIARCQIERGDPQSALYILESLQSKYPATNAVEKEARLLVRATALNAAGRYGEALREVDAAGPELDTAANKEALKVRANSFEGLQQYAEASRAWLLYGRAVSPAEREAALRQAARLALLADDALAVLFICKEAEAIPPGQSFDEYAQEAERRLGLLPPADAALTTARERMELAEGWLDHGEFARAAEVFEPLFLARGALETEEERARVCVDWARCVDGRRDLEEAIRILSELRPSFTSSGARSTLDLGAATILERRALYDRAVEAYGGRY